MENIKIEKLEVPASVLPKLVSPTKETIKDKLIKNKVRIYEFLEDVNGRFSNKRLLSWIYAVASIVYVFIIKDANEVIVGIFATAATGTAISGVFEKRQ